MTFRLRVGVIAVRTLAIEDHYLFVPKQMIWVASFRQADFCSGRAAISRGAHRTNPNPVLRGQLVAIDLHLAVGINASCISNNVQAAVAINVPKAEAVINRGSRLVFDAPSLVHVNKVAVRSPSQ